MAKVRMDNGVLKINLGGEVKQELKPIELGERIEEADLPPAQFAKPIDVDGVEYMPGVDILDWSEDFVDYGGEG